MVLKNLSDLLLEWYFENGRDLPWRIKGGAHPNPYVILVSEFMLQQTTVKTVIPYFHRFMIRFPTIFDLAKASEEEIYHLWQGLGYYSRARSLLACAQMIAYQFDGKFPDNRTDVLKLKGIGPYTVASFLALAFNQPETVIDGNVKRIIARLYHLTQPLDEIDEEIRLKAENLTSSRAPADYASAIMDLGATICTPKKPKCALCPWKTVCLSCNQPDAEQIPARKRLEKKEKDGCVYLIYNSKGEVLIRKRIEKGLLTGLYEFPWNDKSVPWAEATSTEKYVTHIFTHIRLTLAVYTLHTDTSPIADGFFINPAELSNYALSTLMKKVWMVGK